MNWYLIVVWALLGLVDAAFQTYRISIYAPGTEIDGANLDAASFSFSAGMSGPATFCPSEVQNTEPGCPPVYGTIVNAGMSAMSVFVPGGQTIYVHPNGLVKYTIPHSLYMPPGSYAGGWYSKTVTSDCAPPIKVLDFLSTDGSNIGGVMLCPDVPDSMSGTGASYQLYARTPGFNLTDCVQAMGIVQHPSAEQYGSWEYI